MLVSTHVGSEAALELLGISRAEYGHGRIDVAVGRVVARAFESLAQLAVEADRGQAAT